ncbi:transposase [Nonomuraea phyllanthi]|uniref:transposase family protein n=1 Tax=Nonomuraea phyllanthi TaxID=2219224 RepID=UPI001293C308|nr:transposase family protein [Nonomuraea phyllanthi]QFY14344.1 transposase [Nonomuraea phyllanthi]
MLFYRAALPLSSRTLSYLSGILRRHRKTIGTPWRRLNPGQQALLVLVHLRKGETLTEVAAGFGIGIATTWRYIREAVTLLARRSPRLDQALRAAKRAGYPYLVLDGTLIPIEGVAADRPYYSGKHKKHGMNIQVLATPDGTPLWTSGSLPGSVHDLKAARIWGILRRLQAADLVTLADKGYVGAGEHVRVPYKGRDKPASQKAAHAAHAKLRGPGERANAQLQSWRILRKLRSCPLLAGQLVKAILVLQLCEAG